MAAEQGIVLITGFSGRIGSAVARRLTGCYGDVVGFDRKAPSPAPPGCASIPVDIASDDSLRKGLRTLRAHHGAHIAAVVHLAAYYDFLGKPSPKYGAIGRVIERRAQLPSETGDSHRRAGNAELR